MEKILPNSLKRTIAVNKLKFYNIDAYIDREKSGGEDKSNMIMQAAFFKIGNVMTA